MKLSSIIINNNKEITKIKIYDNNINSEDITQSITTLIQNDNFNRELKNSITSNLLIYKKITINNDEYPIQISLTKNISESEIIIFNNNTSNNKKLKKWKQQVFDKLGEIVKQKSIDEEYLKILNKILEYFNLENAIFYKKKNQKEFEVNTLYGNKISDKKILKSKFTDKINSCWEDYSINNTGYFNKINIESYCTAPLLKNSNFSAGYSFPIIINDKLEGLFILESNNTALSKNTLITIRNTIDIITYTKQLYCRNKMLFSINERLINIFNSTSDAVFIVSIDGNIIEVNKTAEQLSGYSYDELLKFNVADISRSEINNNLSTEIMQSQQLIFGTELKTKSGQIIPIETREKIIKYDHNISVLIIARNDSQRREANRKIVKTISDTQDNERKRFSENLHDNVGPLLSTLKLYVNLLNSDGVNTEDVKSYSTEMIQILNQTINEIRDISRNIMPSTLTNFGFKQSITDFCEKITKTGIIKINYNFIETNCKIEPKLENLLYGVIKELINNTIKHGAATTINLHFEIKNNNLLIIKYEDNGIGFSIDETLRSSNKGLGIKSIISKINALNGKIYPLAQNNKGFALIINIPITEN